MAPLSITISHAAIEQMGELLASNQQRRREIVIQQLELLAPVLVDELRLVTPVGEGPLSKSTRAAVIGHTDFVEISVTQPATRQGLSYQDWVVQGRGPGRRPPVEHLMGWVQLKWQPQSIREQRRMAHSLAIHIGRVGTKGNPYPLAALEHSAAAIEETSRRLGIELNVQFWDFENLNRPVRIIRRYHNPIV